MDKIVESPLVLSSTHSMQISLNMVKNGKAGLNAHRQMLLDKTPTEYKWAVFKKDILTMMDLAYLTAKTGDEFAILSGKKEDILFHGSKLNCDFENDSIIKEMLISHRYEIYGHSHPGENIPVPSLDDKRVLRELGQQKSRLISGMTGMCIEYDGVI